MHSSFLTILSLLDSLHYIHEPERLKKVSNVMPIESKMRMLLKAY
ncbi:hypothetical protein gpAD87_14675 [Paenibacillus sp. AD87]|nr:hypothetical protein gpAD87_14675 [Paenibacillus sp. AD87]SLJ96843.1 hypothetical protein SAMN06272722_102468 [Paenibacillus sp. RU5A]SOC67047.1 hypothetical protein SAMN05880581_102530 [Paenibacillus sp. RU26A]SOC69805.1 hypothetical protein SAMN05880586_102468 [Paenibacillus sp. RU5M]